MTAPTLASVARGSLASGAEAHLNRHQRRFDGDADGPDAGAGAADYYSLVTDFYEYGWGHSFHFAPRFAGESVAASITRMEHTLAHRLGIGPGQRVLDAGCGVGGPMRAVARFADCRVDGVSITPYQVERANRHNAAAGLADRCRAHLADFTDLPFADDTFDAAFSIAAICHADDRSVVYRELARVVRGGGWFGGTDWCLTAAYDDRNAEHRRTRRLIEEGNGLAPLRTIEQMRADLERAGVEDITVEDWGTTAPGDVPWYRALEASWDSLNGFRRTGLGRSTTAALCRVLERTRLAPAGTLATARMLNRAADGVVAGGRGAIFSPLVFFRARTPEVHS